MLADKLGGEVTEFFLPRDFGEFCCGCTNCFMKGEEKCPHYEKLDPITKAVDEADVLILTSPVYVYHCTVDNHCDIGLAFDGDADRCLAVDEKGELIDGDKILAIFSKYMKNMGILKNNTCVVTVMTNLGFFKYAKANGIVAATTKVGDRYVLEEMLKGGYNIGGEQSGHIILLDYANTGDGELTGTKLLTVLKCTGEKASELASCMECYPQVLVNVKITADKKGMWDKVPEITDAIKMYSEKLGDEGRILVRESGTEPLVRVMIEGKRTGIITEYAHNIAELIEKM